MQSTGVFTIHSLTLAQNPSPLQSHTLFLIISGFWLRAYTQAEMKSSGVARSWCLAGHVPGVIVYNVPPANVPLLMRAVSLRSSGHLSGGVRAVPESESIYRYTNKRSIHLSESCITSSIKFHHTCLVVVSAVSPYSLGGTV